MTKSAHIQFVEAQSPIRESVTKFGGQPVWHAGPQWPLSASTGKPMRFVCQIALDPELFGNTEGKMAYIFMTDDDDEYVDTFEPDGGENAVIIQPGDAPQVECTDQATGPTLYRMRSNGSSPRTPEPCEFAARLTLIDEPDFVPQADQVGWDKDRFTAYSERLEGTKVGGTPLFIQGDEFPEGGPWTLLVQIDSQDVPFEINFGDAGVAYSFVSANGRSGKFLWQCF